jgi:REP element-mobilizing transposase RayT
VPRKLRQDVEGGVHHVYARGNDGRLVYRDDLDRVMYLRMLGRVVRRNAWRCLAYCLMDNHLHLLIETPKPNLGSGMQWLHGLYAQTYNERHGRNGHVFQGRYGAVLIESDEQLCVVAAYIARNPLNAGLCRLPGEWPWSSYGAAVGGPSPDWLDAERLLWYFGAGGGEPRRRYAALVAGATEPVDDVAQCSKKPSPAATPSRPSATRARRSGQAR